MIRVSTVGNACPFVRNITFTPTININIEGYALASANFCGASGKLNIGTERMYSVFCRNSTSVIRISGNSVGACTDLNLICFITSAPTIRISSCNTFSMSSKGCL